MAEVEVLSLNENNEPQIDNEVRHFQFTVEMPCSGCSGAVGRALMGIPEVRQHTINLQEKKVEVWCTLPYDDILAAIKKTGKKVCFLSYRHDVNSTHSMLLGSGWDRGKFYRS